MLVAPQPRRPRREVGRRDTGERAVVVLDGEIDGDVLRATARAASEHPRIVEASATPEALECDTTGLRSHPARQCRKPGSACQTRGSGAGALRPQNLAIPAKSAS